MRSALETGLLCVLVCWAPGSLGLPAAETSTVLVQPVPAVLQPAAGGKKHQKAPKEEEEAEERAAMKRGDLLDLSLATWDPSLLKKEGITNSVTMSDRILLFTNIFGAGCWNASHLPLFLKSVREAPSIDVLFVGDPPPPDWLELPDNARFVQVTAMKVLADLAVFIGHSGMMHAPNEYDPYKLGCELKPLIPALYFKDYFANHKWFGWMDNDMLVSGEAMHYLVMALKDCNAAMVPFLYLEHHALWDEDSLHPTDPRAPNASAYSHASPYLSYGPITLFRAATFEHLVIPTLYKRGSMLREVWARKYYSQFDEWGMWAMRPHEERPTFGWLRAQAKRARATWTDGARRPSGEGDDEEGDEGHHGWQILASRGERSAGNSGKGGSFSSGHDQKIPVVDMTPDEAYSQSFSSVLNEVWRKHGVFQQGANCSGECFLLPEQAPSAGCQAISRMKDRRYPGTFPGTQLDDGTPDATVCEIRVVPNPYGTGRQGTLGQLFGDGGAPAAVCHFHHRKWMKPLTDACPSELVSQDRIVIKQNASWEDTNSLGNASAVSRNGNSKTDAGDNGTAPAP